MSFVIDADTADIMADEPVWAKVGDRDFGAISKPHGHGAKRYDGDGNEVKKTTSSYQDGEWQVVGWITSGGYGHSVKASFGQGYIPAELAKRDEEGLFEIEILGQRRSARINLEPLFDPSGERMRM